MTGISRAEEMTFCACKDVANEHCTISPLKLPDHVIVQLNQYRLIVHVCIISILYNLGILHFMQRLPKKIVVYLLSRQCLTWSFKLIMCQNYPMLNAAALGIDSEN